MRTGFKALDKIIDIEKPQIIMLVGNGDMPSMFSGDIANNVCLEQGIKVLEIVDTLKEYLIKRMFVNCSNVNYWKWTQKDKYSDDELKQIGQSTANLIETTRPLPYIIERTPFVYERTDLKRIVLNYANDFADRDKVKSLVVLDLNEFSFEFTCKARERRKFEEARKILKDMKKISKELRCPMIITTDSYDKFKKYGKYIDTFITMDKNVVNEDIYDLDVLNSNEKIIGNCKIRYNSEIRMFENKD